MRRVILFGGGDSGGLLITDTGVHPIPPFDPDILLCLKATAAMVTAVSTARHASAAKKISNLAMNLCNLAVSQVEGAVGTLDEEWSLVFQDDDGGFTCGSTGKPPIPIPWPPQSLPSVSDVIASGVIEADLMEFLRQVRDHKIALIDAFEKPMDVAKSLGIILSEKTAKDLQVLAPSRLAKIKDPIDREIIGFFLAVAKDGRHQETWYRRPYEVSQALDINLSESALSRIVEGKVGSAFVDPFSTSLAPIDIVVIIIIVTFFPMAGNVNDRSGLDKI